MCRISIWRGGGEAGGGGRGNVGQVEDRVEWRRAGVEWLKCPAQ